MGWVFFFSAAETFLSNRCYLLKISVLFPFYLSVIMIHLCYCQLHKGFCFLFNGNGLEFEHVCNNNSPWCFLRKSSKFVRSLWISGNLAWRERLQPLLNYVTPGSKSYNGICIFYTSYLIRIIKILTLDESLNKLFDTLSGTYVKECKLR